MAGSYFVSSSLIGRRREVLPGRSLSLSLDSWVLVPYRLRFTSLTSLSSLYYIRIRIVARLYILYIVG